MKHHHPARALLALLSASSMAIAQGSDATDLSTPRAVGTHPYEFVTAYLSYAPDGSRLGAEETRMECDVTIRADHRQQLTCRRFELKDKDGVTRRIPALEGWENVMDEQAAEVLGIAHADFQGLTTDDGQPLSPDLAYRVYNTFVDFYAFNNIFAQPVSAETGRSIADLTSMGVEIEHYSAYSEPPVDLGDSVKKGSYFKNGRVTLEWLGNGTVKTQPCAIVSFDSGESSFQMLMEPAPGYAMEVKGGSHYWGTLFINLDDYWVEKATFREFVTTRMVMGEDPPMSALIQRMGTIRRVR
ncbi:MAG: hypothetical protein R3F07_16115 [Opitutaceae bacterium]